MYLLLLQLGFHRLWCRRRETPCARIGLETQLYVRMKHCDLGLHEDRSTAMESKVYRDLGIVK